jgi:protein-S-isoprenylcysteine O-methyltransferase Ste14
VNEVSFFGWLVVVVYIAAGLSFFALLFVTAPYGRHTRPGWGPTVASRTGWVLMESPAVLFFAAVYAVGDLRFEPVPLALLATWMLHYVRRAFVYPFRMRSAGRPMPLSVVAMGFTFNLLNAYLNARWISHLGPFAGGAGCGPWLWIGIAVFVGGWLLNGSSDNRLIRLRGSGEAGYRIPQGGGFRWITCPNYFGEIVEWSGWALASRSPAAVAFAVFTVANLVPRALAHHRWYRAEFPDYPRRRKALIPFLL